MKDSPAIVLVTTSFPIAGDGSEAAGSFVSDLAEELSKHRAVRVVAPGVDASREQWAEGVEIFRFPAPDKPLSTLKPWSPADLVSIRRVLSAGETTTRKAVQAGPTAHILALWALPSGHWARKLSRETDVPFSVWTLGSDIWSLGRIPVIRGYLRRVLRDARTCYSDGYELAGETRLIGGREVEFLPSTRRMTRARTSPLKTGPPYRLLFLGRWHPNKGIDLLIEALKLLKEDDWKRIEEVQICGGGPLEPLVRAGVELLRATGRPVTLHGYLDKPAAEIAILRADYLLIPSRIESIPVIFSDAIKLGCAVISTPVGDLGELMSKHSVGVIAQDVSPIAIRAAICKAISYPTIKFGQGLHDVAGIFDAQRVAEKIAIAADHL